MISINEIQNKVVTWVMLCMLLSSFSLNAQQLILLVKKGEVSVSGSFIKSGKSVILKSQDEVHATAGARALVKNKSKIVELPQNKKLRYTDVLNLLNKAENYSRAFVEVASKQQYSAKRAAGVVTRGGDPTPETSDFLPQDSVFVLSDSLSLLAGHAPLVLKSDIKVYAFNGLSDTLFLNKDQYLHRIKTPAPGVYCWTYKAYDKGEYLVFTNWFLVPEPGLLKEKLDSLQAFESSLSDFSPEMQNLLRLDYIQENKIYIE